jgi:hypothetical protein
LIDGRTFEFEANDANWASFRLTEVADSLSIELNDQTVLADGEGWKVNDSRHPYYGPQAATYGWRDPDTLVVRVAYVETPFVETYTLAFADQSVDVSRDLSASFGPTKTGPHRANLVRP